MTSTSADTPPAREHQRWNPLGPVGGSATRHIAQLQRGYREDRPDAVAALARIRRGAGRSPGEVPDLWGLTGTELLYAAAPGWGESTRMVRAENAMHVAVTLWALHQQSHREAGMHQAGGPELGGAVRRLMPDGDIDEPIRKRFVRAATASSLDVLAQRLREIVVLLRVNAVPLDYGVLAEQLFQWQQPGGPAQVHRAWGRSFHSYRPKPADIPDTGATDKDPE
jgi:CRISPR system Cascade subunit CasB